MLRKDPTELLKGISGAVAPDSGFIKSDIASADQNCIRRVYEAFSVGIEQNKTMRFVKGMLLVMWLRENGATRIKTRMDNLDYTPMNVAEQNENENSNYIWVSDSHTAAYIVVASTMCKRYGNREHHYGNVHIPGEEGITMVSFNKSPVLTGSATVTWTEALSAVERYAYECGAMGFRQCFCYRVHSERKQIPRQVLDARNRVQM